MSAWIVSKKHIDLMVAGIVEGTRDGVLGKSRRNRDKIGQMLVTENVASIRYRYEGSEKEDDGTEYYLKPYAWEDPKYRPTVAELYKAVDCYAYQACEHPEWRSSAARRLCDAVQRDIRRVYPTAKLFEKGQRSVTDARVWPAWDAAPWGFNADTIALCYAAVHYDGKALLKSAVVDGAARAALSDWLQERGLLTRDLDVIDHYLHQAAA